MNIHKLAYLFLGGLLMSGSLIAQVSIKVGMVDESRLIKEYHLTKMESAKFAEKNKQNNKLREKIQQEAKDLYEQIQEKLKLAYKAQVDGHDLVKKELIKESRDLANRTQAISKDLQEFNNKVNNETKLEYSRILKKLKGVVREAVKNYAKENGYTWIIETSGKSDVYSSPLVYARDATDVTEKILKILNKDAPKENKENKED